MQDNPMGQTPEWGEQKKAEDFKKRVPLPSRQPQPTASPGQPQTPPGGAVTPPAPPAQAPNLDMTVDEANAAWAATFMMNLINHPSIQLSPEAFPNVINLAEKASNEFRAILEKNRGKKETNAPS